MQDSKINQKFNRSIISPQFRASQNVMKPARIEEKQGMSTAAKWAIGVGLTALATYGIYALTKGRVKGKALRPKIEGMNNESFIVGKNERIEGVNQLLKGKAILADGTGYTGSLTVKYEDRSRIVMEYINGVLQKSTKTAKDGTKVFDKAYTWTEDGLIKEVKMNGNIILDENKLIEVYKKANTSLFEKTTMTSRYPNVVRNLEAIETNIEHLENTTIKKSCSTNLEDVKCAYGFNLVNGKMTQTLRLENGLLGLRKQNEKIRSEIKERLSKRFEERYSRVLQMCQSLDGVYRSSTEQSSAMGKIKESVNNILDDLGYKFEDFSKKTAECYEIERLPNCQLSTIYRAIVDKEGNIIRKGNVFAPLDF